MTRIIGLTGGIASGKSTVSDELKKCGIEIIDADAISRTLLEVNGPAYDAVAETFPKYINEDGTVDRRALGAYVFANEEALAKLNGITHPIIVAEVKKLAEQAERCAVIDAPLLIEVGLDKICDEIWLVTADRETRVTRVIARNGLTREEAEDRIDRQMPEEEKRRRAHRVIENNGTMEMLYTEIEKLKEILKA